MNNELKIIHLSVCEFFNIDKADLFKISRKNEIVLPRQFFHYLCRNVIEKITNREIAEYFSEENGRTFGHATIIHSCKVINDYLSYDLKIQEMETLLKLKIESKLGKPLKEIDYTNPLYPVSFVYDRIV